MATEDRYVFQSEWYD